MFAELAALFRERIEVTRWEIVTGKKGSLKANYDADRALNLLEELERQHAAV